jgi:REP element-mobilizing transposase RayT
MAHNQIGAAFLEFDGRRSLDAKRRMSQPVFVLDDQTRPIVEQAIRDHAAFRGWRIVAINVRTTHVHISIADFGDYSPEEVTKQCKSWGTRRLIAAGFVSSMRRVWADHGSMRNINSAESLQRMIEYITNWQEDRPEWR